MKSSKLLICVLGLTLSGWSVAKAVEQPELSATYQDMFQAAWDKAGEGELPVYECTRVVSTASKMLSGQATAAAEAQQAYKACYVDAILNYTDAFFKAHNRAAVVEGDKPSGCSSYSRYLLGHVGSLEAYAERFDLTVNDLNQEISARLIEPASLCSIEFN